LINFSDCRAQSVVAHDVYSVAYDLWPPPGGPGHLLSQHVDIYLPAALSPMK
jgi:hypothetical protein